MTRIHEEEISEYPEKKEGSRFIYNNFNDKPNALIFKDYQDYNCVKYNLEVQTGVMKCVFRLLYIWFHYVLMLYIIFIDVRDDINAQNQ